MKNRKISGTVLLAATLSLTGCSSNATSALGIALAATDATVIGLEAAKTVDPATGALVIAVTTAAGTAGSAIYSEAQSSDSAVTKTARITALANPVVQQFIDLSNAHPETRIVIDGALLAWQAFLSSVAGAPATPNMLAVSRISLPGGPSPKTYTPKQVKALLDTLAAHNAVAKFLR